MSRVYKTARGKMVDIDKVKLSNEQVIAVGNMKVNARGDAVDDQNQPIKSRPQKMHEQYQQQIQSKTVSTKLDLNG